MQADCIGILYNKGQDKRLKFDKRDQGKGKLWDFSNQVHDNMFWSLTSGKGLTIFQSITMWLLANNYSLVNSFSSNPFWFLALFYLYQFGHFSLLLDS